MSQPSVTAYFNARKRQATDELTNKGKVVVLEREKMRITRRGNKTDDITKLHHDTKTILDDNEIKNDLKVVFKSTETSSASEIVNSAVRNIQFDSSKTKSTKTPKMTRARASKLKKNPVPEDQPDIKEAFLKMSEASKTRNVLFEKKGLLSPRKAPMNNTIEQKDEKSVENSEETPAKECVTPTKKSTIDKLTVQNMSLADIKNKINKSSRLNELRERIERFKKCEEKLEKLQSQDEPKPKIKKFEKIELEVPISPQKLHRSPLKTPTKAIQLPSTASPQRRLLFAPKESSSSPVKCSPTKVPAYQRYQSLVESGAPSLQLPYSYRFLAEVFRCVETISAMLYNRKENITFKKLKPAVQELLRRNFSLEHLTQIKTVFPNAYNFSQEKLRSFEGGTKQEKYELVLTPILDGKVNDGRKSPRKDGSTSESTMGPGVLLERRRKFYNVLLEKTKSEHEKFLLSLENPMIIAKEKITRWHPEFDVDNCPAIVQAELPQPPTVEKATSAQDVLERAKSLFNCNTRMEKALQRLADAKMTAATTEKSVQAESADQTVTEGPKNVETSVVDTPPATPTTQNNFVNPALKGIPKALLERVRAKQAAKALEAMTRTPNADKEATIYSRLPEIAKILRNIFVAEKKSVLTLEFVIKKLDNSFRTKLTPNDLEEHIRLMCKLLPTWASIHNVRKLNYLKIAKDIDIAKVVKRFEIMANDKLKS